MTQCRLAFTVAVLLLAVCPLAYAGERHVTDNFIVDAPTKELARTFGEYAEKFRREKAIDWLGSEMPRWPQKCPLKVQVTMGHTGGATTFTFGVEGNRRPAVMSQEMKIFGSVEQLLHSVLPHEVTHTVFAHHFGQPVPRWSDEGGSVLSENDDERFNHDVRCREVLNQGRGIPLRVLFKLKDYPKDMIVLYAQGYSITQFLVDQGGKQKLLQFIGQGMKNDNNNWEDAVRTAYGYGSVDELQEAWITALRNPPQRVAARNNTGKTPTARTGMNENLQASATLTGSKGIETRSSAAPGVPMLEPPVVARGATPTDGTGPTFGGLPTPTPPPGAERAMSPAAASATPRPPLPRELGLLPPEPPSRR